MKSLYVTAASVVLLIAHVAAAQIQVRHEPGGQAFELASAAQVAAVMVDPAETAVVRNAARLLADDVERVTMRPAAPTPAGAAIPNAVIAGTLGQSATIDRLVSEGKIDVSAIRGKWEAYQILTVDRPAPDVERGLVVVGSDRRGTAFGLISISEAIGVSPWTWWADAPVARRDALYIDTSASRPEAPAVKYRGIFINDEDWGLQPWAKRTYEKDLGDIGPKTYARVFELLLRLKANYCWPAMHDVTRAFNHYPENKTVADEWGIVMGSSHCEPLLRNNVDEWHREAKGEWNWVTNREEIVSYLRKRVEQNGKLENVWTVGMRGIHDSGMPGGGTLGEKTQRLEDVIRAQRALLAPLAGGDASKVPQAFIPYKETLDIYANGTDLPDDVTIVWPDDNHGYIRRLSTPEEQTRSGGGGVYYHASYWGSPISYLWLDSTPPAQIWLEMTKAHAFKCDRLWVVNVGDIKSNERATSYFLQLAWNPADPALADQKRWLTEFARANVSGEHAGEIGAILNDYYKLCAAARPEQLGRSIAGDPLRAPVTIRARLADCDALYQRALALESQIPADARDAYFQLVLYPVSGMTATNVKYLAAVEARRLAGDGSAGAAAWTERAESAWARVLADTKRYNEGVAGGKWNGIVQHDAQPRVDLKQSSLLAPVTTPSTQPMSPSAQDEKIAAHLAVDAAELLPGTAASLRKLQGLGYDDTVALLEPRTLPEVTELSQASDLPALKWTYDAPTAGTATIVVHAVPAHAPLPGGKLRCALSVNGKSTWVDFKGDDEKGRAWSSRVLLRRMSDRVDVELTSGRNEILLRPASPSVVVDAVDVLAR